VTDPIPLMMGIAVLAAALVTPASDALSSPGSAETHPPGLTSAGFDEALSPQTPFAPNLGQAAADVKFCAHIPAGAVLVSESGEVVFLVASENEIDPRISRVLTESAVGGSRWPAERTRSPSQTSPGFDLDVWVARLGTDPTTPGVLAFVGGSADEIPGYAGSVVVGEMGNVFIAGRTHSSDFPTTTGAFDESYNFWGDVFVSRLGGDLRTLMASTYLGEWGFEYCGGLAVDGRGNVYVAGGTRSSSFPTTGEGYDPSYNGEYDIFLSRLNAQLASLHASTFLGGSGDEFCGDITVNRAGGICVTGRTGSADFPGARGDRDRSPNGETSIFVSRFDPLLHTISVSALRTRSDIAFRPSTNRATP